MIPPKMRYFLRSKVRRRQEEAFEWVVRLMPGTATVADLEEFKRWSSRSPENAQAFRNARQLWEAAGSAASNVEKRRAASTSALHVDNPGFRLKRRAFLGGAAVAAAASYVVIRPPLGLWPSLSDLVNADYRTGVGEQRRLTLAGDVSVEMNTQTSIALRRKEGLADRIELMSGEGVITVEARVFEVISGSGRAWARDASFSVRHNGGASRVTCLHGTVQVGCGKDQISLTERQQISYSDYGLDAIVAVDPGLLTAWRDGYLVFHDTPLKEVISETNRYRHGRIVLMNTDLGSRLVNARFRLDRIDDVITKVTTAFGATATSLPGGMVIIS